MRIPALAASPLPSPTRPFKSQPPPPSSSLYFPFSVSRKLIRQQFIKEILQKQLNLPLLKRKRRFATENHFVHFGRQLWGNDWHIYEKLGVRVETWSEIQLYAFTSARVGEYVESTCRSGSGRGLYHRVSELLPAKRKRLNLTIITDRISLLEYFRMRMENQSSQFNWCEMRRA